MPRKLRWTRKKIRPRHPAPEASTELITHASTISLPVPPWSSSSSQPAPAAPTTMTPGRKRPAAGPQQPPVPVVQLALLAPIVKLPPVQVPEPQFPAVPELKLHEELFEFPVGNDKEEYVRFLTRFWKFYRQVISKFNCDIQKYKADMAKLLAKRHKVTLLNAKGRVEKLLCGTVSSKYGDDFSNSWRTEFETNRLNIAERTFESSSGLTLTLDCGIVGNMTINHPVDEPAASLVGLRDGFVYCLQFKFDVGLFHYFSRAPDFHSCLQFGYRIWIPYNHYANCGIKVTCTSEVKSKKVEIKVRLVRQGRDKTITFIFPSKVSLDGVQSYIMDKNGDPYLTVDVPILMR